MRLRLRLATSALLGCAVVWSVLLVAGCGEDSESTTSSPETTTASVAAPVKSEFPSAKGKTLGEVVKATDGPAEVVVSHAARAFYEGENRYPLGVFEVDRTPVGDAQVALYIAKVPPLKEQQGAPEAGKRPKGALAQAREEALKGPAFGPFPAATESLATKAAFRAQTTANDPDAPSVVYVADVDFPSNGEWRVAAIVKQDDEFTATLLPSVMVGEFAKIPRKGDRAPLIHTPTPADAGGDLAKITTRVPPDTQNRVDYADVLGKKPIALLFATPQFCQSRVCGPVVDVAEQVKETYGDQVAFIHMEIFNDNDPSKDVRPQVRAFHLPTEPWLFVIDRQGRVQATIEGAFGIDRLTRAVKGVSGE